MSSSRRSNSAREAFLDNTIQNAGYGYVHFRDNDQKSRFVDLLDKPIIPTRFLDRDALMALGLKSEMKTLLKESGCPGLYHMCEHTYAALTLEFLSSFFYDVDEPAVNFRLFNKDRCLYPKQWAKAIGCWNGEGKEKSTTEPRDGSGLLWTALTGQPYGEHGWRFKTHFIQHPVLRVFCRLIGNTYFARPEPTNMKSAEIHMLFSYLNIDGGVPFKVDIGHYVAKHLEAVATGTISQIMVGGLITYIAKQTFKRFDESKFERTLASPSALPLTMDLTNLSRMRYIKKSNTGELWWWKIGNEHVLTLPERQGQRRVRPIVPTPEGDQANMTYYLVVGQTASPAANVGNADHDDDDDNMGPGIPIIEPMGEYAQSQHYPFHTGPYNPEGYDLTNIDPTFATYPPFVAPPVWNNHSIGSMLWGLCNQMHQVNLDNSIAAHNLYNYHVNEGHVPTDSLHPAYYVPELEYMQTSSASNAQSQANDSAASSSRLEETEETSD